MDNQLSASQLTSPPSPQSMHKKPARKALEKAEITSGHALRRREQETRTPKRLIEQVIESFKPRTRSTKKQRDKGSSRTKEEPSDSHVNRVRLSVSSPLDGPKIKLRMSPVSSEPKETSHNSVETNGDSSCLKDEPKDHNNVYCECCGGFGMFICCDACPRSFHLNCTSPPTDPETIQPGSWFCKRCSMARASSALKEECELTARISSGIFWPLMLKLDSTDPTIYSLPAEIKGAFESVAWDKKTGEFVDLDEYRLNRHQARELRREKKNEDSEDTAENISLPCSVCSKSSLLSPMISCDFCPTRTHLDCVDPPLTTVPSGKFKCSRHVEHTGLFHRKPRQRTVKDNCMHSLSAPNSGEIQVELDEQQYKYFESTELTFPTVNFTESSILSHPLSKSKRKIDPFVVYRVPERIIKLKFIEQRGKDREIAQWGALLSAVEKTGDCSRFSD